MSRDAPEIERPPAPLEEGTEADQIERAKRAWLAELAVEDVETVLFRLETLLKAMDRFFNTDNHPRRREGPVTIEHDLRTETEIVDRQVRQLLGLTKAVLDESDTSAFVFQSYVETQLLSDRERDLLLQRHLRQRTPQESLYLLQIGLAAIARITEGLLAADTVRLPTFRGLGHHYTAMLVTNRYFNPLRVRGFNPLYDRVRHPLLQRVVRQADGPRVRRALSFMLVLLGRYLNVLRWIRPAAPTREELLDGLPLLCYLHSEFRSLIPYLEHSFAERFFPGGLQDEKERQLYDQIDAFAFQLRMESRKVFHQLLVDITVSRSLDRLRSAMEAVHGLLVSFLQQTVVGLVQTLEPGIAGRDLFADFVSRYEQSVRLREDLWIFHELLRRVIAVLEDSTREVGDRRAAFQVLGDFLTYFVDFGFQLVRYEDHESFERFFDLYRELYDEPFTNPTRAREVARSFEHFRIFVETTLGLVNQRADLQGVPLDEDHARRLLAQFWKEDGP